MGNEPVAMDKLKSLVRLGALEKAVCLSIRAETLSRPVDFVESRKHSSSVTCSSVQSIEAGQLSGSSRVGLLSGGNEWLKHSKK